MNRFNIQPLLSNNICSNDGSLNYTIKVYNDINDPDLVYTWTSIAERFNYFPQSSYEWCAPWWQYMRGQRELHIIAVANGNAVVGVAPFCIEHRLGIKVLRSFPIHFGDFYTFLVDASNQKERILNTIVQYLTTFSKWDFIRIDQVNSEDMCSRHLRHYGFMERKMTDIIEVAFEGRSFEQYMESLSSGKHRGNLQRSIKLLQKDVSLQFEIVTEPDDYIAHFENMSRVYSKRWKKAFPQNYCECKKATFLSCFKKRNAILYLLKANDKIIGYHLGFLHNNIFFSWNICFDPDYARYSPGNIIQAYTAKDLIENGRTKINHMAGTYEYKSKVSSKGEVSENFVFFLASRKLRAKVLLNYYLKWRDILKLQYHGLMEQMSAVKKKLQHFS